MLLKIGSKVVNPMCLHKPSSDQFPSLTIQGIFGILYRERGWETGWVEGGNKG